MEDGQPPTRASQGRVRRGHAGDSVGLGKGQRRRRELGRELDGLLTVRRTCVDPRRCVLLVMSCSGGVLGKQDVLVIASERTSEIGRADYHSLPTSSGHEYSALNPSYFLPSEPSSSGIRELHFFQMLGIHYLPSQLYPMVVAEQIQQLLSRPGSAVLDLGQSARPPYETPPSAIDMYQGNLC